MTETIVQSRGSMTIPPSAMEKALGALALELDNLHKRKSVDIGFTHEEVRTPSTDLTIGELTWPFRNGVAKLIYMTHTQLLTVVIPALMTQLKKYEDKEAATGPLSLLR